MLFEVRDNDNSDEDSASMEDFFKKVADFDPSKTKFRWCGLYNKKVHIKKAGQFKSLFRAEIITSKLRSFSCSMENCLHHSHS